MYVTDSVFEKQIGFLRTNYEIISLKDLLGIWRDKRLDENRRYCAITLDDGWADNYTYAYPILMRYKVPATVFLPTSFIGTEQWFWTDKIAYLLEDFEGATLSNEKKKAISKILIEYGTIKDILLSSKSSTGRDKHIEMVDMAIAVLKELPVEKVEELIVKLSEILGKALPTERLFLNWKEVEEMSKDGITFGSHSCSHRILTMLPWDQVQKELDESMSVLKTKNVNYIPVFCYPNGDYNEEVKTQVETSCYEAAVGIDNGIEGSYPREKFSMRRITIHQDISKTLPLLSLHMLAFGSGKTN